MARNSPRQLTAKGTPFSLESMQSAGAAFSYIFWLDLPLGLTKPSKDKGTHSREFLVVIAAGKFGHPLICPHCHGGMALQQGGNQVSTSGVIHSL